MIMHKNILLKQAQSIFFYFKYVNYLSFYIRSKHLLIAYAIFWKMKEILPSTEYII